MRIVGPLPAGLDVVEGSGAAGFSAEDLDSLFGLLQDAWQPRESDLTPNCRAPLEASPRLSRSTRPRARQGLFEIDGLGFLSSLIFAGRARLAQALEGRGKSQYRLRSHRGAGMLTFARSA
jgi:hypothetical protein